MRLWIKLILTTVKLEEKLIIFSSSSYNESLLPLMCAQTHCRTMQFLVYMLFCVLAENLVTFLNHLYLCGLTDSRSHFCQPSPQWLCSWSSPQNPCCFDAWYKLDQDNSKHSICMIVQSNSFLTILSFENSKEVRIICKIWNLYLIDWNFDMDPQTYLVSLDWKFDTDPQLIQFQPRAPNYVFILQSNILQQPQYMRIKSLFFQIATKYMPHKSYFNCLQNWWRRLSHPTISVTILNDELLLGPIS